VNGSYNRGFNEAKGAFIVPTDADVTVDNDAWLKSLETCRVLEALRLERGSCKHGS
jgi:glycosyltransferase involved in cell wall biosynthesis